MSRRRTGFAFLDDAPSVIAFAHRGGAYHPEIEGLENTLAAFRHAVALGYRYLETDVHVTRDGMLLAFHDAVLDRVTDRTGAIAEVAYAEVREALVGGREQVPTLAMLFEEFPDARFNIDLKSEGAVDALVDFVAAREAWDRVLVSSFSGRRLQRFRRRTTGRVATCAHPAEIAAFLALPAAGLARWASRGGPAALQVPHHRTIRGRSVRVTSPALVRRAHDAAKHVHVWTIDTAEEMHELLDRGVDGLMTDRTDILKDVLVARGQWEGQA